MITDISKVGGMIAISDDGGDAVNYPMADIQQGFVGNTLVLKIRENGTTRIKEVPLEDLTVGSVEPDDKLDAISKLAVVFQSEGGDSSTPAIGRNVIWQTLMASGSLYCQPGTAYILGDCVEDFYTLTLGIDPHDGDVVCVYGRMFEGSWITLENYRLPDDTTSNALRPGTAYEFRYSSATKNWHAVSIYSN